MALSHPKFWPVDSATGAPIPPRAHPGYYPRLHTLGQKAFWDEATRALVVSRIKNDWPPQFFDADEFALLRAICDRILPQDDRDADHTIPIAPGIDQKLTEGRSDGYRFETMPEDGEAHRLGLQGIEAIARHLFSQTFVQLGPLQQDNVLKSLHDARPPAAEDIWQRLPVDRYWKLLVQDVVEVYYAHPYAWDEIGFGGPAYPRGYMRLENGEPEPWESEEVRYNWRAPAESLSDKLEPLGEVSGSTATPGQGGAH